MAKTPSLFYVKFLIFGALFLSVSALVSAQDEDAISCSDGLDNDFDGLTDLEDDECVLSSYYACYECPDGISFADEVLEYQNGCIEIDDYPKGALGVCDWNDTGAENPEMVHLGNEGWIRLRFNNNHLLNSGDADADLRILQAGVELDFVLSLRAFDETTENELIANGYSSPNNDGFYTITSFGSLESDLDIDQFLPGFLYGELKFDAIEIKDAGNGCDLINGVSGVRIDAVCAMTSQFYSPAFSCSDQAFLFQGFPEVGVYEVDLIAQSTEFITDDILSATGFFNPLTEINGYGYNPIDNKIWGVWGVDNAIVRINANFKVDSVVIIPEFTDNVAYGSGDINSNGIYSIFSQWDNTFYNIDLDPLSPNYLSVVSNPTLSTNEPVDWAFSPFDGRLYTVDSDFNLISISTDGTIIEHGITTIADEGINTTDFFNAAWMDGNGSLYVQSGNDGDLFRIDNPHLGFLEAEFLFTGPQSGQNDGARCLLNVPYDCNQIVGGTAIFDECGECLELNDPNFNQSCLDCNGLYFGSAILDECGECSDPNSPLFNQSCIDCSGEPNGTWLVDECGICNDPSGIDFNSFCADCAGVPNGEAVIDECGACLLPDSPEFNLSCTDCAGIVNGTSEIDECGECHEVDSPEYNQSCLDCAGIPNGTSEIDECGDCLNPSSADFNASCTDCNGIVNGDYLLDECGACFLPNDPLFNQSCVDCAGIPNGNSIIDLCGECWPVNSEFFNGCVDCQGTVFGDWFLNICGICTSPEEIDPDIICYGDLIFVPNSFTPDNDGTNDVFTASFAIPPVSFEIIIFDRWGQRIFQTQNYLTPWLGNVKDGDHFAENGVYTYSIIYRSFDSVETKVLNGHITLIR